jgi:hypothetical protein
VSRAYCCEVCDAADPHWSVTRRGDVVTTWACDDHLAQAAEGLQRDHEVTELVVRDSRKAREWAGITRTLNEIAEAP